MSLSFFFLQKNNRRNKTAIIHKYATINPFHFLWLSIWEMWKHKHIQLTFYEKPVCGIFVLCVCVLIDVSFLHFLIEALIKHMVTGTKTIDLILVCAVCWWLSLTCITVCYLVQMESTFLGFPIIYGRFAHWLLSISCEKLEKSSEYCSLAIEVWLKVT